MHGWRRFVHWLCCFWHNWSMEPFVWQDGRTVTADIRLAHRCRYCGLVNL